MSGKKNNALLLKLPSAYYFSVKFAFKSAKKETNLIFLIKNALDSP